MKKVVALGLLTAGGWYLYKRLQADRAEQRLWAEATDSVKPASR